MEKTLRQALLICACVAVLGCADRSAPTAIVPDRHGVIIHYKADDSYSVNFAGSDFADNDCSVITRLGNVKNIDLSFTQISDKSLGCLDPEMVSLDVSGTRVTDQGLEQLVRYTKLSALRLLQTSIGDAGMSHVQKLHELTLLDLSASKVTDEGVFRLSTLTKLKVFAVNGPSVSDKSVDILAKLPQLTDLDLTSTRVSDRGLEKIASHQNLQKLKLNGCIGVTDLGLKHLKTLPKLTELEISGTSVTDSAIADIASMKQLKVIYLGGTLTAAGLARLRSLRPDVEVLATSANRPNDK